MNPKILVSVPFHETPENTVSQFLRAVKTNDGRMAQKYLSKRLLAGELTDPAQLFPVVTSAPPMKQICRTMPLPKNKELTCAEVLLANHAVLRIHLMREADRFGAWKIYAIESREP